MVRKFYVACNLALTRAYNTNELLHILPDGLTDVDHGGSTALHLAAEHNMAMGAVLIAAGANINAKGNDGNTPLFIAVSHTQPDVVCLLLLAHADINATNNEGKTPVQLAADEVVRAVFNIIADAPQKQAKCH
ncbi:hypothetical protein R5R35_010355 [Gryllus longicercus]|uniref:Uncharacterized protein n=1 Tax=Gryllus longicercus TaxID=2509291 RepID=A0AAN9VUB1_9ORTH